MNDSVSLLNCPAPVFKAPPFSKKACSQRWEGAEESSSAPPLSFPDPNPKSKKTGGQRSTAGH